MRIGLLQVALAGVLWGTGGLVVQLIRRDDPISPLVLSSERMLIGTVAMLVVLALGRTLGDLRELWRRHPVAVWVVGGSTGAYQALYFVAVTQVGVAVSTMVSLGIAPVLLASLESVRRRALPSRPMLVTLVVALAGLALVCLTGSDSAGPHPVLGVVLSIVSGTTYAITTAVGQRIAGGVRPTVLATGSTLAGAVVLAPLLLVGLGDSPVWPTSAGVAAWLLYLGVATMGLAYLALYAGLRTVPAAIATLASLLEPVTAAFLAALVLDERLTALGIVGCVLVLAAVAGLAVEEPPGL
ncbi:DMT family transporter [Nocardioides sp. Kera G14]|uniref:DMT family transporter n=1 Tax=Nocardioides sp. Kera G14 TaxID=2884264 RepID=UPI001D125010|nr:DMT family transporter [Nocardioides sp. Kera G14]UDY23686.1 DMT family transporter [Nocardioides sp. Kera G14]